MGLPKMDSLVFAVLALTTNVVAPFEVHIHPRNEVVVQEYQDLEVECKLDQRIRTNHSLNWNAIWKLSDVSLISFGSFEPRFCSPNVTTDNRTKTVFMTSCNKSTNSIKLKVYNVSSTKHGAEIGCILRILVHQETYKDTTTIYVQVPLKTATITRPKERIIHCNNSIQLECQTSPSRPQANIAWSVVRPADNSRTGLVDSQEFYNNSELTTTSYLNYSTKTTLSEEVVICEASNGISTASSNVTLKVRPCTVPHSTTTRPTTRGPTKTTPRPIIVTMTMVTVTNEWLTTNKKWILITAIITALLIFIIVTSICFSKQCTTSYVQEGIAKTRRTLRRRGTHANSTVSEGAGHSHPQSQNMASNNVRHPSDQDDVYARIQPKTKQKKPPIEGQVPISLKSLVVVHSLSKNRAKSRESVHDKDNTEQKEKLNYIEVELPENENGEIHGVGGRTVYTWVNMPSERTAQKTQNVDKAQSARNEHKE